MPTIEEIKTYLGIDGSYLDSLLADLLSMAKELIEKTLRYKLTELDTIPATIKETAKLIVSAYYNNRESINQNEIEKIVAMLLSEYRRKEF